MSHFKLKDRIQSYQDTSSYKLLSRVPVIICINGRSFSKTTELLDKPYCAQFAECMFSTTLKLCHEIEGALFAYQFSDEIVIVSRNDQHVETAPWYGNNLQKISSITSSIATLHFSQCAQTIDLNIGDPTFSSQVFAVPTLAEAINTMVYKQQTNFHNAIQHACLYELLKKYDKNSIKEMLTGLTSDEKIDLLSQECEVEFNTYPKPFLRGAACYKIPKIVDDIVKNKWAMNSNIPIFSKDTSFLSNIFKNGSDIFRKEGLGNNS